MTIANTFASKLFVGVVAIAMALSLVAPAQAQTEAELQAQIDQLMATIAALQAQVGQTPAGASSAAVCPYAWTRSLSSGSTGADVMTLQKFLNSDIATQVASAGAAGSAGMETQYYGPATAAAVSNFQVKYRDEILTPNGLVNPTGYFGPSSIAKANALCSTAAPVAGGDDDDDDDTTTGGGSVTLRGEASLDVFDIDDADDTEIQEGDSDAPVAVLTVEFTEGDAELSRLDVILDGGDDEERPWNVFREVSLWVDGDEIASKRVDSRSDYLGDETDGRVRFTSLGIVAMEDEEVEIVVAVTVQNTVKGSDDGEAWTVGVDSIRFFDADGVATTLTSGFDALDNTAAFTIEEAGINDEARIRSSNSNPDSTTLKVESNTSKSDEYTVFVFDIDVEDDSSDLVLDDAVVRLAVTNPAGASNIQAQNVISDVYLRIDGKRVKGTKSSGDLTANIAAEATGDFKYTFDFRGLELESDERYAAELSVVFAGQNAGARYENGVKIQASVNSSDDWELEGINTSNALTGSTNGNEHTLATVVPIISGVKSSISQANNVSNSGSIIFEFKIEAEDDDVTLTRAALVAASTLTDSASTSLALPTPSLTKISGDASGGPTSYTISEGQNATFRLTYTFTTTSAHNNGNYTINLETISGQKVDITSDPLPLAH
jgi:peptidoglycan hydrolase-like protein with peptidoglycan-binding domain